MVPGGKEWVMKAKQMDAERVGISRQPAVGNQRRDISRLSFGKFRFAKDTFFSRVV